jgi:N-methylhydantoinase A/oxoprolinase/acetone carboxylase beta subunit
MQLPVMPVLKGGGLDVEAISIAIDRGGTFTDIWASCLGKADVIIKLLSIDPEHYKDAPTEGMSPICYTLKDES